MKNQSIFPLAKSQNVFSLALGLLLVISTQSCISNKAFQTARTMDKGSVGFGAGLGFHKFGENQNGESFGGSTFEGIVRYGITDRFDAGLNFSFIGTSGFDLKYQFLGDHESEFAGSISGGLSILQTTYSNSNEEDSIDRILDFNIPVYFSFHPIENFALYISPKYVYRTYSDIGLPLVGGLGGMKIGNEISFFVEMGFLNSITTDASLQTQFNLGFAYKIN